LLLFFYLDRYRFLPLYFCATERFSLWRRFRSLLEEEEEDEELELPELELRLGFLYLYRAFFC